MAPQLDPEVAAGLAVLAPASREDPPAVGDVEARRRNARRVAEGVSAVLPEIPGVQVQRFALPAADGASVPLLWYRSTASEAPGSAALYLHGGGMIIGWGELGAIYDTAVRSYVAASGVPLLVVDYRIAPEHPHPTPVEDCYEALGWLVANADELGVDPKRVAVMGDSAGGGLAAAICLLARDRAGPAIAAQLLAYPMLDDRTPEPDPALAPLLTWSRDDDLTAWAALLGGTDAEASPYAAPARARDLSGLPPAYIDVGDLDLFVEQDLDYARRLTAAGVATELHVHPGCPHAFEVLAPQAAVSRRVMADRVRRLAAL